MPLTNEKLAVIFGVSTTTIGNWVNFGYFENISRTEDNSNILINEDTWFCSPSGIRFQVSEAMLSWEKEEEKWNEREIIPEIKLYQRYLDYFSQKYSGNYEETLGRKEVNQLTAEEETDKSMWQFFLAKRKLTKGN